jgi:hypothetical protein
MLNNDTQTRWWHDSAIPREIDLAMDSGALGVTTNPCWLTARSAPTLLTGSLF